MKKLLVVIFIIIGLYFIPATASADSPVTSTTFSEAYKDVTIVKNAADKGVMNSDIAKYLYDKKNPIDIKAAVINALSWGPDNKANTEKYCLLIYKKSLEKIEIKNLRGDQLFCIGYLLAMDNYFDTSSSLAYLRWAEQEMPDSFTVAVVRALVDAMNPSKNIWQYIQPLLNDTKLKMDMRTDAVNIILNYMAIYSESDKLIVSHNNVMIRNEKSETIYLYGTYIADNNKGPYQIAKSSNIAYTALSRDRYGIYYITITGVKNGFSSVKIVNDGGKSITINFSVASKNTFSKLNNTLAMYIGNTNSYIGKTSILMSRKETPYLKNNNEYIPVKFVAEAIGGNYNYDSKKNSYRLTYGHKNIILKSGNKNVMIDGKASRLSGNPELKNGILFVSASDFVKLVKKKLLYDNGLILITDNAIQLSTVSNDYIMDEIAYLVTRGKLIIHEPIAFIENGKYGFKDDYGKVILKPTFNRANDFNDGLAVVSIVDEEGIEKFGFIDIKGNYIINPVYNQADSFASGLAPVLNEEGTKWGYIDQSGKLIIPYNYSKCYSFQESLAAVQVNGKWGYIDKTGNMIIQPIFDEAYSFSNGLASVALNDNKFKINLSGMSVFVFTNGDFYVGQTKNGLYHGNGVYTWADGTQYTGEFQDGELTGKAIYTDKNGTMIEGYWEDGSYLGNKM